MNIMKKILTIVNSFYIRNVVEIILYVTYVHTQWDWTDARAHSGSGVAERINSTA